VDARRLRFDFSHFQPVDKIILDKIEKKANSVIFSDLPVKTEIMKLQQAKEKGAKALFDEKYAEDVRVVSVGDFSSELCGGTHVSNSGQIGIIRIMSETGIAAGVRRIEALTGFNAFDHLTGKERQLEELASIIKSPVEDVKAKLISILDNNRELSKQLDELKQEIAARELGSGDNKPMEINGLNIFSKLFTEMDAKTMRETADMIKESYPDSVILIGSVFQDKVSFIVSCSDKAVSRGLNAGEIIREVAKTAGGGGGGRATLAQAGGKDPLMADAAIKRGLDVIKDILV
jgi:alanyl-tRNA synthetase